jgi:cellulose synthase/poly-beta-1,6-N-acetylglucosamine synthase-like glycosyltransferase
MKILLWSCAAVVLYSYLGYPLILLLLRIFIHRRTNKGAIEPMVTFIVPAHNEADVIEDKIRDTIRLDYPADKSELLIASDGSVDDTVELARRLSDGRRVRVLAFPRRRGKISVLNDAVRQARGEVVILSDAAATLNPESIRRLVSNFADSSVGAVCGTYRVQRGPGGALGKQEAFYWKYETFLKIQESALSSVVGGHGQILATRKELYPYPPAGTINDDCVIPLRIIASGSRIIYEPLAIASEAAAEMGGFQRRVRIMAGNIQQLREVKNLLRPLRGLPLFFFLSHKAARTVVPFTMLFLAASNIFLLDTRFYQVTGISQLLFYCLALAGGQWKLKPRVLHLPYYFCFINAAYLWGAYQSFQGPSKVSWK